MSSGGKGGSSSASTPDYTALAKQQGLINQQTAQQITAANRPTQIDPYGNSVSWTQGNDPAIQAQLDALNSQGLEDVNKAGYSQDAATNAYNQRTALENQLNSKWTQTSTLSPTQLAANQKTMSDTNAATSSFGDMLNNYLKNYQTPTALGNFSSSAQNLKAYDPGTVKSYDDPSFNGDNVANALYKSVTDRTSKTDAQNTDMLGTQLRQQGLVPGSEAYNRAMQNLMTSQGDANSLAAQNATLAGSAEARNQYNSYLSGQTNNRSDYASYLSGQGQQYSQDANTYGQNANTYNTNANLPLQQLSGLAGMASGTPYTPSYTNYSAATGYSPTDLVGAATATTAANQASTNSSNSKKSGLLGAGASLGGSYLGSK